MRGDVCLCVEKNSQFQRGSPYSIHIAAVPVGALFDVGRPVPDVVMGTDMYSAVTVPLVPVVKTWYPVDCVLETLVSTAVMFAISAPFCSVPFV